MEAVGVVCVCERPLGRRVVIKWAEKEDSAWIWYTRSLYLYNLLSHNVNFIIVNGSVSGRWLEGFCEDELRGRQECRKVGEIAPSARDNRHCLEQSLQ